MKKNPPIDPLEITTDQERRKVFLRYINRAWLLLGIISLATMSFFPQQRSQFIFLIAIIFPSYLITRFLNLSGRTKIAGIVFTLAVNFGFYGLFMTIVGEVGANKAFETETSVWLLMGLAVLFAGALVDKWSAPLLAALNSILLIGTQLVIAPNSDPRPSAIVFWWMMALTVWLYEDTLHKRLRQAFAEILDREQAEVALHENENLLLESQNIANIGGYVLDFTTGLWKSSAVLDTLFGIDDSFSRTVKGWTELIHPDQRQQMTDYFTNEVVGRRIRFDKEYRIVRKSDQAERWVLGLGALEFDAQNNLLRMHGTIQDITERKLAESALAASEAELRALFASMNDAVLVIDREGIYRKIAPTNPDLLYMPADELIGKSLWDIFTSDNAKAFMDAIQRVLITRKTIHIEYQIEISNKVVWFESSVSPIDEDNTLWVARDITERKQADEVQAAHYKIANAAQSAASLNDLFTSIHRILETFMAAENFYIAMYDEQTDMLSFPYFVDQYYKAPLADHPGNGLPEYVLRTRQPLLATPQVFEEMINSKQVELPGMAIEGWIGVPLTVGSETFGIMVVQTYTNKLRLTQKDLEFLSFVATQVAMVIERKQTEETLQQFKDLMDESNDAIFFIDMQTSRYIDFNKNALAHLGYTQDELHQLGVIDIAEHVHNIEEWHERVTLIDDKIGSVYYTTFRRKNGTTFPVEVSEHISNYAGKTILVAVVRNNTERKQAEEAVNQRLAEEEILNQASHSLLSVHLDPETIYSTLHFAIAQIMPCEVFSIVLDDENGGDYHAVYLYDTGRRYPALRIPRGQGLSGRVISNAEPLFIHDNLQSNVPPIRYGWPKSMRSILAIPLQKNNRTIGMVSAQSHSPHAYSERHRVLLETLASQFTTVIENARLFDETTRRAQEFASLYETSKALSTENELGSMLQVIVEHAKNLLGCASSGMYLYLPESDELELTVGTQYYVTLGTRLKLNEGVAGRVAQIRQPIRVDDYSSWEGRAQVYDSASIRAVLEVPMLYGGELIGVLTADEVGDSERKFTEADERLLSLFATQAAGAIHSARLREQTTRRLDQLQALYTIDRAISSYFDLRPILDTVISQTIAHLGVDAAAILLFHPHLQTLEYVAGKGFYTHAIEKTHLRLGEGFAGLSAFERRTIHIPNLPETSSNFARASLLKDENFLEYYAVPLVAKGELKGILEVFQRSSLPRNNEWRDFLETLAGQAAITLDQTQLFDNLQRANLDLIIAYDATIEGWSRAMDLRDKETEGHTLRVTEMTIALSNAMGINKKEILHIKRGALLHDIGKMGVPDYILFKEGELTDEEWVLMRRHPQFAYEMLRPIKYLQQSLDIPYCHHEKWDGTGYPRGLQNEQIPLVARIFAVIDVWDAVTIDRPYRKAWTKQKALKYIRDQSNKHFDPKVVAAFLKLFDTKTNYPSRKSIPSNKPARRGNRIK